MRIAIQEYKIYFKNLQKPDFQPFKKALGMLYDLQHYLHKVFFYVKIHLLVTAKYDQDPDPH